MTLEEPIPLSLGPKGPAALHRSAESKISTLVTSDFQSCALWSGALAADETPNG